MKFATLAFGLVTTLSIGNALAQSAFTGNNLTAPYVPEGYEPIDYNPSAIRDTSISNGPAAPIVGSGTAIAAGGYAAPQLPQLQDAPFVGDVSPNSGYRVEDLQSDFNATIPSTIYFDFDQDRVTSGSAEILKQQAQWLSGNPEATVHLTGHADAVGANSYNYRLGLKRAKSTAKYLVGLGVETSRMKTVVSKGEQDLAIPTEQRERLNRRVMTRVTGIRKIPLPPAPVAVAPPPPPVKRLPPPPPAAKEPAPIERAQIPKYTPPPRNYTPEPPACPIATSAVDSSQQDLATLRGELEGRMNAAIGVYNDPTVVATNSTLFFWAHFTKTECGLAVGYSKSGTRDQRSIDSCRCGGQLMSHYQGAI